MTAPATLDLDAVEVLLCDADGNLFPSEEPAFEASAGVTNRLLAELGVDRRYSAVELRLATTGKNFRTTAVDLATAHGASIDPSVLEWWVAEEKRRVTAHLREALSPDARVLDPLRALAERFPVAAVSSSARTRLDACFEATGLAPLFPPELRFSAEDSLPVPASKPDPAIYRHAGEQLGIAGAQGLAIEDAVPGVQSAVAAGFPVIGNVVFVPPGERAERVAALTAAGAAAIITGWSELEGMLAAPAGLAE
jgi:beta-phosphoglucomutase-like phosphatase (HAD superfamily)